MLLMLIGGFGGFTTDLFISLPLCDKSAGLPKDTCFFSSFSGVRFWVLILKQVDFDNKYIDFISLL